MKKVTREEALTGLGTWMGQTTLQIDCERLAVVSSKKRLKRYLQKWRRPSRFGYSHRKRTVYGGRRKKIPFIRRQHVPSKLTAAVILPTAIVSPVIAAAVGLAIGIYNRRVSGDEIVELYERRHYVRSSAAVRRSKARDGPFGFFRNLLYARAFPNRDYWTDGPAYMEPLWLESAERLAGSLVWNMVRYKDVRFLRFFLQKRQAGELSKFRGGGALACNIARFWLRRLLDEHNRWGLIHYQDPVGFEHLKWFMESF
jgi:hypothetical protein